jgi:soluble lytic murein transglycosylase-like protein
MKHYIISLLFVVSFGGYATCFEYAAGQFGVDVSVLRAIAAVESNFQGDAMSINSNHSYDIGIMQINSVHKPVIEKAGLHMADLLNPCTNVIVGAWLLQGAIQREDGDVWKGVGRYHSATPKYSAIYIRRIQKAFNQRSNSVTTMK